jgi:hypothetical protein
MLKVIHCHFGPAEEVTYKHNEPEKQQELIRHMTAAKERTAIEAIQASRTVLEN